ncbi:hypothetical protein AC629_42155 [Bradyrhizobium sp. NAS80.1]|nr:hypothetical protein AC629_42155 [Bradyrhizobium sp. NAS80.1]OKO69998.1 hypothetical protein AC630_35695 [Bradyrhizobium sp. AS23.2]
MVLCHVIGIESKSIACLRQSEAIGVMLRNIAPIIIKMVEDAACQIWMNAIFRLIRSDCRTLGVLFASSHRGVDRSCVL